MKAVASSLALGWEVHTEVEMVEKGREAAPSSGVAVEELHRRRTRPHPGHKVPEEQSL